MSRFLGLPDAFGPDLRPFDRQVIRVVNQLLQGKTNNTGRVTLTPNETETIVLLSPGQLGENTVVLLTPVTASAAAEMALGTCFVSSHEIEQQQFRITHAINAANDRSFQFALIG